MAFYKKFHSKLTGLWYPKAVTTGAPVSTDKIADKLSLLSTVTRGDTYAVIKNLGNVMADYMAQGRTVKLEGVGTFYYTAAANKKGVPKPEDVNASQIVGVRVRFIPEVRRNSNKQVVTRSMVDTVIGWMDIEKLASSGETSGSSETSGSTGSNPSVSPVPGGEEDQNSNPLG